MTTTGVFSQAVSAAVRALWDSSLEEQSSRLYGTSIGLGEDEPDVPEEQISEITGPGRGAPTVEGQTYTVVSRAKGYPMTYNLRKYTFDLSYTEEDLHWIMKANESSKRRMQLTTPVNNAVQALYQNINEDVSKVFYLGFGTTFQTGGNSEALFASHTVRVDASTQLNTFASGDTHRPFGSTALQDALIRMDRYKAHNGLEMLPVRRARVLCSKELAPKVQQILNSLYGPANANLGLQTASKEAFSGRGVDIDYKILYDMPVAYKDYWFVISLDRAQDSAFLGWGWRPRMTEDKMPRQGAYSALGSVLFGFAWRNAGWAFGSKGDDTAI